MNIMKYLSVSIALLFFFVGHNPTGIKAADKPLPLAAPESEGVSPEILAKIDEAVNQAIGKGKMPGAVVVIVHQGKVIFRKAYGRRSLEPERTDMLPEIVFDLASLTKPIATALSIMMLVEQGKLRVGDLVSDHVPGAPFGGAKITVEQLLLHTSGLAANNAALDYKTDHAKALETAYRQKPSVEPGTKFTYSSLGYIILGDLVARLSGLSLDEFTRRNIYEPLGMNETTFNPQGKLKDRAAPTENREGQTPGQVHDPRAFYMGGVAGHAGLFSSADDLAVFAQMLLQMGEYRGRRILAPDTVRFMTTPRPVPGGKSPWYRNYGWDVETGYSSNRGDGFEVGTGYGHTGFTGTSMWIDPATQTVVIFLSNRVHPDGKGDVAQVRRQVATLAAQALNAKKTCDVAVYGGTAGGVIAAVAAAQRRQIRAPSRTWPARWRHGFRWAGCHGYWECGRYRRLCARILRPRARLLHQEIWSRVAGGQRRRGRLSLRAARRGACFQRNARRRKGAGAL